MSNEQHVPYRTNKKYLKVSIGTRSVLPNHQTVAMQSSLLSKQQEEKKGWIGENRLMAAFW